jgi:hypothetical protein
MDPTSTNHTTIAKAHRLDHAFVDKLVKVALGDFILALPTLFRDKSFSYPSPY